MAVVICGLYLSSILHSLQKEWNKFVYNLSLPLSFLVGSENQWVTWLSLLFSLSSYPNHGKRNTCYVIFIHSVSVSVEYIKVSFSFTKIYKLVENILNILLSAEFFLCHPIFLLHQWCDCIDLWVHFEKLK